MIRLILFDLWNTLAYRDVNHSTISLMLKKTRLDISKENFLKIFENSIQLKRWDSKKEAYRKLCINLNLNPTEENINLLINIRDYAEKRAKLYPHTIAMLKKLRKQGYKVGLIGNTSIFAFEQVKQKTNLLDYVDYLFFSFDMQAFKQDKESFEKILKITELEPEQILVIGDKLNDDVVPPKKQGLNALLYKDYETLKKELVSFAIDIK